MRRLLRRPLRSGVSQVLSICGTQWQARCRAITILRFCDPSSSVRWLLLLVLRAVWQRIPRTPTPETLRQFIAASPRAAAMTYSAFPMGRTALFDYQVLGSRRGRSLLLARSITSHRMTAGCTMVSDGAGTLGCGANRAPR